MRHYAATYSLFKSAVRPQLTMIPQDKMTITYQQEGLIGLLKMLHTVIISSQIKSFLMSKTCLVYRNIVISYLSRVLDVITCPGLHDKCVIIASIVLF